MKKINIGCGWECRKGWINADNTQKHQRKNYPIIEMDVTDTWAYPDEEFDYILSEHMIEHIPDEKNLYMLTEAYRTLKKDGVIRISCPNRTFFETLCGNDNHSFVTAYCEKIFQRPAQSGDASRIAKRTLNEQGHVWVPTINQLILQLKKAGFSKVYEVKYGESEFEAFQGIEVNDGVRNWESIVVEGRK
jgi:2-polyprenyl-3-methyl-5-hydroxy-6-metoxy-1,4-benzoquinol methylase